MLCKHLVPTPPQLPSDLGYPTTRKLEMSPGGCALPKPCSLQACPHAACPHTSRIRGAGAMEIRTLFGGGESQEISSTVEVSDHFQIGNPALSPLSYSKQNQTSLVGRNLPSSEQRWTVWTLALHRTRVEAKLRHLAAVTAAESPSVL